ncbi:hypothetical protein [Chamaesiphon sp.]|uniref:hypothetical protein n=1 Tax=Chamaesiphon sp. TaxID=2814140 RepID=UPI003593E208
MQAEPTEQIAIDFPKYITPKDITIVWVLSEPNPHDRTAKQLIANRIEKDSYLQSHVYQADYVKAIDSVLFHKHCRVYKVIPPFKNGEYYYPDRDYPIRDMLLDSIEKSEQQEAIEQPALDAVKSKIDTQLEQLPLLAETESIENIEENIEPIELPLDRYKLPFNTHVAVNFKIPSHWRIKIDPVGSIGSKTSTELIEIVCENDRETIDKLMADPTNIPLVLDSILFKRYLNNFRAKPRKNDEGYHLYPDGFNDTVLEMLQLFEDFLPLDRAIKDRKYKRQQEREDYGQRLKQFYLDRRAGIIYPIPIDPDLIHADADAVA